ncbi:GDP-mannose 4,6-dehydratase [Algoriphagus sp.]|uniref:GDP-mannose 4,6-dehydratase n=1 Tax=Algoriphagus sp. TaxID=1872435 RepID=UPI0025EA5330|nr:GDP-mannose 4,6-dehydratase [Algoriphagus sp.]
MKKAIITGITGQDGAYLAQLLIQKGYKVIGLSRQNDLQSAYRLVYLGIDQQVEVTQVDLTNPRAVMDCLEAYHPDEIYNLAAQSSVGQSFKFPQETFSFNTLSVMNLLEGIRQFDKNIRFYQASSSEMFGSVSLKNLPIRESLLFHPVSPYGISKASAHWLTVNYREAYGLFTACGILFNHESSLRGENFVVKKIINTAIRIKNGEVKELNVGNLAISRDWGYAPKYVEAMWLMLQQNIPADYVICSGQVTSLLELINQVFNKLDLDLRSYVRLDPQLLRSLDLAIIYGDNSKAKQELGWEYEMDISYLISRLIQDEEDLIKWKTSKI